MSIFCNGLPWPFPQLLIHIILSLYSFPFYIYACKMVKFNNSYIHKNSYWSPCHHYLHYFTWSTPVLKMKRKNKQKEDKRATLHWMDMGSKLLLKIEEGWFERTLLYNFLIDLSGNSWFFRTRKFRVCMWIGFVYLFIALREFYCNWNGKDEKYEAEVKEFVQGDCSKDETNSTSAIYIWSPLIKLSDFTIGQSDYSCSSNPYFHYWNLIAEDWRHTCDSVLWQSNFKQDTPPPADSGSTTDAFLFGDSQLTAIYQCSQSSSSLRRSLL